MDGRAEKALDQELKGLAKFVNKTGPGKDLTTRLKHQIIAIDVNREKKDIREFVDNDLFAQDLKNFHIILRRFLRLFFCFTIRIQFSSFY